MTRHSKRSRSASPPPSVVDPLASAESPVRSSSRIEVRGLDLELVATPARMKTTLPSTSDTVLDSGANDAQKEASAKLDESEALRAELPEIAVVLDLPSKRIQRPKTMSNVAVLGAPLKFRELTHRAAHVVVLVGLLIGAASLQKPEAPTLPEALLGGWIATNQDYEGRELGFVESELVMRLTADAALTRYPITSISSRKAADTTVLGLTYVTEGGPVELHARLIGGQNPILVFDRPTGLVLGATGVLRHWGAEFVRAQRVPPPSDTGRIDYLSNHAPPTAPARQRPGPASRRADRGRPRAQDASAATRRAFARIPARSGHPGRRRATRFTRPSSRCAN